MLDGTVQFVHSRTRPFLLAYRNGMLMLVRGVIEGKFDSAPTASNNRRCSSERSYRAKIKRETPEGAKFMNTGSSRKARRKALLQEWSSAQNGQGDASDSEGDLSFEITPASDRN